MSEGDGESVRILGIDPGLNKTGYAIIVEDGAKARIVEAGVLRSSERLHPVPSLHERLRVLFEGLVELITQLQPDVMVVEQLFSHYKHPRTAILMGHARGVILLAGSLHQIDVLSYAATRIKKTITGAGRASKEQMQLAMLREFCLTKMPEPPDVADALAIALCHFFARKHDAVTRKNGSHS